jgi:hypothetical protein
MAEKFGVQEEDSDSAAVALLGLGKDMVEKVEVEKDFDTAAVALLGLGKDFGEEVGSEGEEDSDTDSVDLNPRAGKRKAKDTVKAPRPIYDLDSNEMKKSGRQNQLLNGWLQKSDDSRRKNLLIEIMGN